MMWYSSPCLELMVRDMLALYKCIFLQLYMNQPEPTTKEITFFCSSCFENKNSLLVKLVNQSSAIFNLKIGNHSCLVISVLMLLNSTLSFSPGPFFYIIHPCVQLGRLQPFFPSIFVSSASCNKDPKLLHVICPAYLALLFSSFRNNRYLSTDDF